MEGFALQLKISLVGITPKIWRRVVVNSDIDLGILHEVIQIVMNWNGTHLHKFYTRTQTYMMPYDDCEYEEDLLAMEDYEDALVCDLLYTKGQHLKYEYDFGDSWVHDIVVEELLPPIEAERDAHFIKGKNAAPPDDCGGVVGYQRLREILADPSHPEYEDMAEWMGLEPGERFDPTYMMYSDEELDYILDDAPLSEEEENTLIDNFFNQSDIPEEMRAELMLLLKEASNN